MDAARFGDYGILIGADAGNTGYRDVRITYTIASDNQMGGIFTYAQNPGVHENVYVGHSSAFNNSGKRGLLFNSGNGITLADVACGCTLGYLDLRFPEIDWRTAHPNLAKLADKLATRASFQDTVPVV